ncbi:MAG: MBL fold metallo-hydrolase [Chitinophagaceae bacterium]|nr:MBL fold metallo-hydrolase [Chitinophagaceae bacterium]
MAYPSLTITFLGTGTSGGIPMIGCSCQVCTSTNKKDKRLRSSILVRSATTTIVVDSGPDFRYQMLREKVMHLDAIVFTHPHKDHVAGLDDVRAYNFFSGRPMNVFANEMTQAVLIREFPYAFADTKYPGVPDIILNTIAFEPFVVGDIPVVPIMVWHMKMPVLGFRFGNFTYITDANRIEESEMVKIQGSEYVTLNTLRKEAHISHFNLQEGIAVAQRLNANQTYFTHLSHQMGLHDEVSKELPPKIELAYDGLVISL